MLPAHRRVTRSDDFGRTFRRGVRAGRSTLVVHVLPADDGREDGIDARAGFVVSKAVGNSVVRHRVVRRLRHVVGDELDELPAGTLLVIRALPAAATAASDELRADLRSALQTVRRRMARVRQG